MYFEEEKNQESANECLVKKSMSTPPPMIFIWDKKIRDIHTTFSSQ